MDKDCKESLKIILGLVIFCINLAFAIAGAVIIKNSNELASSDEDFHLA
jgi:hypothetical protein